MKVVLINPPTDLDISLGSIQRMAPLSTMVPLGLGYISAILLRNHIEVEIIDTYAKHLSIKNIVEEVMQKGTEIVGISCVTPSAKIVHSIAKEIKNNNKNVKIVLNSSLPSVLPEETVKDDNVDFVVRGEGKITF